MQGKEVAMLKTILVLTALILSANAFAHDDRDRDDRDFRREKLVPDPVIVLPGQAALIQVAPRVVYAPAAPVYDQQPDDYQPPADYEQPVFYSQPAQNASLKSFR
jgi:hypothetical protein